MLCNITEIAHWATILSPIIAVAIAAVTVYLSGKHNRETVERISAEARKQAAETNRLTRMQLALAVENYRLESYKTKSQIAEVEAKIQAIENERTSAPEFFSTHNFKTERLKLLKEEKKQLETHLQQLNRVISDCQTAIMNIDLENK